MIYTAIDFKQWTPTPEMWAACREAFPKFFREEDPQPVIVRMHSTRITTDPESGRKVHPPKVCVANEGQYTDPETSMTTRLIWSETLRNETTESGGTRKVPGQTVIFLDLENRLWPGVDNLKLLFMYHFCAQIENGLGHNREASVEAEFVMPTVTARARSLQIQRLSHARSLVMNPETIHDHNIRMVASSLLTNADYSKMDPEEIRVHLHDMVFTDNKKGLAAAEKFLALAGDNRGIAIRAAIQEALNQRRLIHVKSERRFIKANADGSVNRVVWNYPSSSQNPQEDFYNFLLSSDKDLQEVVGAVRETLDVQSVADMEAEIVEREQRADLAAKKQDLEERARLLDEREAELNRRAAENARKQAEAVDTEAGGDNTAGAAAQQTPPDPAPPAGKQLKMAETWANVQAPKFREYLTTLDDEELGKVQGTDTRAWVAKSIEEERARRA